VPQGFIEGGAQLRDSFNIHPSRTLAEQDPEVDPRTDLQHGPKALAKMFVYQEVNLGEYMLGVHDGVIGVGPGPDQLDQQIVL